MYYHQVIVFTNANQNRLTYAVTPDSSKATKMKYAISVKEQLRTFQTEQIKATEKIKVVF